MLQHKYAINNIASNPHIPTLITSVAHDRLTTTQRFFALANISLMQQKYEEAALMYAESAQMMNMQLDACQLITLSPDKIKLWDQSLEEWYCNQIFLGCIDENPLNGLWVCLTALYQNSQKVIPQSWKFLKSQVLGTILCGFYFSLGRQNQTLNQLEICISNGYQNAQILTIAHEICFKLVSSYNQRYSVIEYQLLDNQCSHTSYRLGKIYQGLGKINNAEQCFENCLKINPWYGPAKECLGRVQEQLKQIKQSGDNFILNLKTMIREHKKLEIEANKLQPSKTQQFDLQSLELYQNMKVVIKDLEKVKKRTYDTFEKQTIPYPPGQYLILHSTPQQFQAFLKDIQDLKTVCRTVIDTKYNNTPHSLSAEIQFLNNLVREHENQIFQMQRVLKNKEDQLQYKNQVIQKLQSQTREEESPLFRKTDPKSLSYEPQEIINIPELDLPNHKNESEMSDRSAENILRSFSHDLSYSNSPRFIDREPAEQKWKQLQEENQKLQWQMEQMAKHITKVESQLQEVERASSRWEREAESYKSKYESVRSTSELPFVNSSDQQLSRIQNNLMCQLQNRNTLEEKVKYLEYTLFESQTNYKELKDSIPRIINEQTLQLQAKVEQGNLNLQKIQREYDEALLKIADLNREIQFFTQMLDKKDSRLNEEIEANQLLKEQMRQKSTITFINNEEQEVDGYMKSMLALSSAVKQINPIRQTAKEYQTDQSEAEAGDSRKNSYIRRNNFQFDIKQLVQVMKIQESCIENIDNEFPEEGEQKKILSPNSKSNRIHILERIVSFWDGLEESIQKLYSELNQLNGFIN